MGRYERERGLQEAVEGLLASSRLDVDVRDVELNEPQESVRIVIDAPGGVDLETCAQVTRLVRDLTDHAIEVSSPGERIPLRHARHFEDVVGRQVRLRVAGEHRAQLLTITGVEDNTLVLAGPDGTQRRLSLDKVTRAALEPVPADPAAKGTP